MISPTSLQAFSVQPRPAVGPALASVKPAAPLSAATGEPGAQTPPAPTTRRGALLDISA